MMGNGVSGRGAAGASHEAFDISDNSRGRLRCSHLRRQAGEGARISVVRLLQFFPRRRHELRVFDLSTMHGDDQRGWRLLWC